MDFTAITTAVTTNVTAAISAASPVAGLILSVGVGWKIYKHFTR